MNVLVYGGGAVGLGVTSCLLKAGANVYVVGRESTVVTLKSQGLRRTGIFGSVSFAPEAIHAAVEASEFRDIEMDFVLICTKSFDTKAAAMELKQHGYGESSESLFILFQNGWGNREVFGTYFPAHRIFNARVITGFSRSAPNEVRITVHADDIHVGSFQNGQSEKTAPLCDAIRDGDVPCSATDAIVEDLWAKMLYNCPLNSLGAVLGASYGELADDAHTRPVMDAIVDECFTIMTKSGYSTHWKSASAYKTDFYQKLIPPTRLHYPSTLQDIRAGKRTEIESLNGAIIRLAADCDTRVPVNEAVYHLVKYRESHSAQ